MLFVEMLQRAIPIPVNPLIRERIVLPICAFDLYVRTECQSSSPNVIKVVNWVRPLITGGVLNSDIIEQTLEQYE
jgi:hypothetical protein